MRPLTAVIAVAAFEGALLAVPCAAASSPSGEKVPSAIVAARALATANTNCATVVTIPLARPGVALAVPIPTVQPSEIHTTAIPPACASTDRASR